MKFVVSSKALLSRLSAVSKVVNSKNAIAILDYFLFDLENGVLTVTGSDQENTLTTHFEVEEAEGNGSFAIKVKNILDVLKGMNDQNLSFEINEENYEINIDYQNGNYNFVGLNGRDFPEKLVTEEEVKKFTLPAKDVLSGISHTLFAVATDDIRPVMMGVYWDLVPDKITFVASDMHKLVRYINTNLKPDVTASFVLPAKPASILESFLPKNDEEVSVTIDSGSATFKTADFELNCTFIKGRYPNYNSVIPQSNPYIVTIDRMCLLNAVKRVGVFATVGGLVKFRLETNTVILTAEDIDVSTSAKESISCDYSGEPMEIGFHYARMIEVLGNIDHDTIEVHLSDPSRPGVFTPLEQKENEDNTIVIMPMIL